MGIIARQSIKASLVGIIGVGVGAISRLFIATKFLTVEELGLVDLITKFTLLIITFFILGSPQVIRKYYVKFALRNKEGEFLATYVLYTVFTVLVSSIIYLLARDFITSFYIKKSPLFAEYVMLPLYCAIAFSIFHIFNSISTVKLRIVVPAIFYQLLNKILGIAAILAYGYFFYINLEQFTYLFVLGFFALPALGLAFYVFIVLKPKFVIPKWQEGREILSETRNYNFFLVLSVASVYVIQAIDSQMIGAKMGLAEVGIYSIAFFMGSVIVIPQRALSNISFPILSKAFEMDDLPTIDGIYKKSSINQFLIGSLIFTLIWVNIDAVFEIIPNGAVYAAGKLVVFYIGLGKLFDTAMGVNRQIIEASKHYRFNLLINLLLSALVIVLNLIFIPIDNPYYGGINGAAVASMLAMLISNLVAYRVLHHYYKLSLVNIKFFKILIFFIVINLVFAYAFRIANPFVSVFIASTIIILLYIGFSLSTRIVEKEMILNFIKKLKA